MQEQFRGNYSEISSDFSGYTFRPRLARSRTGDMMVVFIPAISRKSAKRIRSVMRDWYLYGWQSLYISEVAGNIRSRLQGWINYYGRYGAGGQPRANVVEKPCNVLWQLYAHRQNGVPVEDDIFFFPGFGIIPG